MTAPEIGAEALREHVLASLTTARDRTTLLTSCVEEPDLTAQHSPLMSPLVWDLAHIGNQVELWLRVVAGREAMCPEIDSPTTPSNTRAPNGPRCPCWPPPKPAGTRRRYAGACWTCWSPQPSTEHA